MSCFNITIHSISDIDLGNFNLKCRIKYLSELKEVLLDKTEDEENSKLLQAERTKRFEMRKYEKIKLSEDVLKIECLKKNATKKFSKYKFFGKFEMVLQKLEVSTRKIFFKEFLVDPITNSILKNVICFTIQHEMMFSSNVIDSLPDAHFLTSTVLNMGTTITRADDDLENEITDIEKRSLVLSNTIDVTGSNEPFKSMFHVMTTNVAGIIEFMSANGELKAGPVVEANTLDTNESFFNETTNWQIRIRIIKMKYLLGIKENTLCYCNIAIGDEIFSTSHKSVNALTFNEVITHRINNMKSHDLHNKLIKISVFYRKSYIYGLSYNTFGSFVIDLGTVYKQTNHEFYHKWAPIISDEELSKEGYVTYKGYVKCDISIQSSNDTIESHIERPHLVEEEEDKYDIENNLIISDVYFQNQSYSYVDLIINIRKAEYFIAQSYGLLTLRKLTNSVKDLKKYVIGSTPSDLNAADTSYDMDEAFLSQTQNTENIQTYIRLTYSTVTKCTKVKTGSAPEWNEQISFKILYPPLMHSIKLEICSKNKLTDTVIATEYIYIDDISAPNLANEGLPRYGPCHIDIYDEPYCLITKKRARLAHFVSNDDNIESSETISNSISFKTSRSNMTINEVEFNDESQSTCSLVSFNGAGVNMYVARLELKLDTKQNYKVSLNRETSDSFSASYSNSNNAKQPRDSTYPPKDFLLFACVSEASMIDKRYGNSLLTFRLTIGSKGYKYSTEAAYNKNHTKPCKITQLNNDMPFYATFGKVNPCLYLDFKMNDNAHVLHKMNFIRNQTGKLKALIRDMRRCDSFNSKSIDKLFDNFDRICKALDKYIVNYRRVVFTTLDELRINSLNGVFKRLNRNMNLVKKGISEKYNGELTTVCNITAGKEATPLSPPKQITDFMIERYMRRLEFDINLLVQFAHEPLGSFPDVSLWVLCNGVPVGACQFSANDLLWSDQLHERGSLCAKTIYTDVKSMNKNDSSNLITQNIARLKVYLWLGALSEKASITRNLPQDFIVTEEHENFGLPKEIGYQERTSFELCAYIYQGSNLIGMDPSGLSDPFVVIKLHNQSTKSKIIDQTNNPGWSTTLSIKEVFLYGNQNSIKSSPPEVILEVYDHDSYFLLERSEFMGRCYIMPSVHLDKPSPPKLKWHKLYHNNKHAGNILASFELIPSDYRLKKLKKNPNDIANIFYMLYMEHREKNENNIPREILPDKCLYTLEILFWGIRNLRETSILKNFSQNKIIIEIEIGEKVFPPREIDDDSRNANFNLPYFKETIELPKNASYKPHLHIRCIRQNSITNKNKELVGSFTSTSINSCYKDLTALQYTYGYTENYLRNGKKKIAQKSSSIDDLRILTLTENSEDYKKKLTVDLNWWSKYYHTIGQFKDTNNNFTDEDALQSNETKLDTTIDEIKINESSWRKNSNTKNSNTKLNLSLLSKSSRRFSSATGGTQKKFDEKKEIEKITIYTCELEKVDEFKESFREMLDTYPLIKGKYIQDKQNQVQCYFKGKCLLYEQNEDINTTFKSILNKYNGFLSLSPPNAPVYVIVRVYIIKAIIDDPYVSGECNPYIYLKLGDKYLDDYENRKPDNPDMEYLFARHYEFTAKFPNDSQLTVIVNNASMLGGYEIGRTEIDLENRYYAKSYATCGLQKSYERTGYNRWRGFYKPSEVLFKMCRAYGYDVPSYNKFGELTLVRLRLPSECQNNETDKNTRETDKYEYKAYTTQKGNSDINDWNIANMDKKVEKKRMKMDEFEVRERNALDALNDWKKITGQALVPEHVESRSLRKDDMPNFIQGKIQMWVDIFPFNELKEPKPVDFELPKPVKVQLRVIIKNTKDVFLDDINPITKERTSDIYVKGWMGEQALNVERTDVHYKSRTGEGNFNYRLIFDFDYLLTENKIVVQDNRYLLGKRERKEEPILHLQVWDADLFTGDDFIGELKLNLSKFMPGAKTASKMDFKKMYSQEWKPFNLFELQRHSGWWPFVNFECQKLMGKLEADFILLTEAEALENPAGRGHNPPSALELPKRPDDSYLAFLSPFKALRYDIWRNHKCLILKLVFGIFFIIFLLLSLYQLPGILITQILKLKPF